MKLRQCSQPKYIPTIQTFSGRWYLFRIDNEAERFCLVNERQQIIRIPFEENKRIKDLRVTNKTRIKKIESLGGNINDNKREWEQLY